MDWKESTDRGGGAFVLFGAGFAAFLLGLTGIILASPTLAVMGMGVLLLVVMGFGVQLGDEP